MSFTIRTASIEDINSLLSLYFAVYGPSYPISIGYDRQVMESALNASEDFYWLIAITDKKRVVGSAVFQLNHKYKVGKVIAVVVHPEFRGQHISHELIKEGTEKVLSSIFKINALYTTTRTLTVASQLMFLSNSYYPLGIFPNAHKIQNFETLTFMGAFADRVLDKREYEAVASDKLKPLLKISNRLFGKKKNSAIKKYRLPPATTNTHDLKFSSEANFEFIFAPNFVKKLYQEWLQENKDEDNIIWPFETPNLLIVDSEIDLKLFLYFGPKDHYCALIGYNKKLEHMGPHLKQLLFQMKDHGVSYIETLIKLNCDNTIEYLLQNSFLPSALCPAILEKDGKFYDYIFLSRTMEPLDFSNIQIDKSFRPFIDQYTSLWIGMHISSVKIF